MIKSITIIHTYGKNGRQQEKKAECQHKKTEEKVARCNVCGEPLDFWDTQEDFSLHKYVGYGSKYDLNKIDLNMCCSCFDNLVDSCKINPVVGSYDDSDYEEKEQYIWPILFD